jgi:hypothetical protein
LLLRLAGGNPAKLDVFMGIQSFVQFSGVLLDVPDVVQLIFSRICPVCPERPTTPPGKQQ